MTTGDTGCRMGVCACVCVCVCVSLSSDLCVFPWIVHAYTHKHTHTHIQTHLHTHIHTRTHTHTLSDFVTFEEVLGMTEVNESEPRPIKVCASHVHTYTHIHDV
jgi:hypothetical protein